jgi:hypothetical protein
VKYKHRNDTEVPRDRIIRVRMVYIVLTVLVILMAGVYFEVIKQFMNYKMEQRPQCLVDTCGAI